MLSLNEARAKFDPKPSPATVRVAAMKGNLKARKIGRNWCVTEDDYLDWLSGFPHPRGRKVLRQMHYEG